LYEDAKNPHNHEHGSNVSVIESQAFFQIV
jgi:hypothetical protein